MIRPRCWRIRLIALTFMMNFGAMGGVPSAQAETEADAQLWFQAIGQLDFGGDLGGFLEIQPRFADDVSELSRVLIRPAIEYRVSDRSSVGIGYLWMPQLDGNGEVERRPWLGHQLRQDFRSFSFTLRNRLEARELPNIDVPIWRVRTMTRFTGPLSDHLSWVGAQEIFFQFNSGGGLAKSGFDQLRVFLGVNRRLSESFSVEPSYLLNFVDAPGALSDRLFHALFLSVQFRQ